MAEFKRHGVKDITLDSTVMHTVVTGQPPSEVNPEESARCERVASWYLWDGDCLRLREALERQVVPICQRA
jgi:hypothetical protein